MTEIAKRRQRKDFAAWNTEAAFDAFCGSHQVLYKRPEDNGVWAPIVPKNNRPICSYDQTVWLWDAHTGTAIGVVKTPGGIVTLKFLSNNLLLASTRSKILWDLHLMWWIFRPSTFSSRCSCHCCQSWWIDMVGYA
jgi:hypothetical protein